MLKQKTAGALVVQCSFYIRLQKGLDVIDETVTHALSKSEYNKIGSYMCIYESVTSEQLYISVRKSNIHAKTESKYNNFGYCWIAISSAFTMITDE